MAKTPNKAANKDEERDISISEKEAAVAAELVAEALQDQVKAREKLNELIEDSTSKEQELFELMELQASMTERENKLKERGNAFLSDRNKTADRGTKIFYENLKSLNAQVNGLEEIATREEYLGNLKQQLSQNASGQNEEQNAARLQAIELAMQELAMMRDKSKIRGRSLEELQDEADIERTIINYGKEKLKIYQKQDAVIAKVKKTTEGLVSSITEKMDGISSTLKHIPVIGGMLGGVFDKIKEGFEKKLKNASANFVKSFTTNIQSGKSVMESLNASTVGFRTVLMSLMKFALPVLALSALAVGFSRFHKLEDEALAFKKATGLAGEDVHKLSEDLRDVQMASAELGTTIEDAGAAMQALRNKLSPIEPLSNSVARSMIVLNKNLGVAYENAAAAQIVFKNIAGLNEAGAAKAVQMAAEMATVAGLSADQIVKDIGDAAGEGSELLTYVRGGAKEIAKMAVEARLMGSSLEKAAKLTKSLLDWETSITDELELSAVLGQNVNFGRARELAFVGDLVGAQKEVMNQLSGINDISKLNAYEKEALVKATGMELGELENLQRIERKFPGLAKEKMAAAQSLLKTNEDLAGVGEAELDRETARLAAQEKMIGATEKIKNQFANIGLQLADYVVPLGKVLLGVLEYGVLPVLQAIGNVITFITSPFDTIKKLINEGAEGLGLFESILTAIVGITGVLIARNLILTGLAALKATQEGLSLSFSQRRLLVSIRSAAVSALEMGRAIVTAIANITGMSAKTLGVAGAVALASGAAAYAFFNSKKVGDVKSPADGKTRISTKEGGLFELSPNDDLVAAPGIADTVQKVSSVSEMLNQAIKQISTLAESVAANDLSKTMVKGIQLSKNVPTSVGVAKSIAGAAKVVGKVATPVAVGGTMLSAGLRISEGENIKDVLVNEGGGLAGALTGATAGAAIGSIIPGVGTVIGGLVGGLVGSLAGDYFTQKEETPEMKPVPLSMPMNQIPSSVNVNVPAMQMQNQNMENQNALIAEFQALRNDLTAGKVAVYMNGNKVTEQLRATERKDPVTEKVRK